MVWRVHTIPYYNYVFIPRLRKSHNYFRCFVSTAMTHSASYNGCRVISTLPLAHYTTPLRPRKPHFDLPFLPHGKIGMNTYMYKNNNALIHTKHIKNACRDIHWFTLSFGAIQILSRGVKVNETSFKSAFQTNNLASLSFSLYCSSYKQKLTKPLPLDRPVFTYLHYLLPRRVPRQGTIPSKHNFQTRPN
jgi:hypothetical protein